MVGAGVGAGVVVGGDVVGGGEFPLLGSLICNLYSPAPFNMNEVTTKNQFLEESYWTPAILSGPPKVPQPSSSV